VVITGAASGLGRAMALALASRGCRIAIADIDMKGAAETLSMVERAGGSGEVYKLDVRAIAEWEAMADHLFEEWGKVDVLINNAGVVAVGHVGEVSMEDWEWIFGINFWGMLYGCHAFVPRMKAQAGGHIVNVASAAGILCMQEQAPYNTTKAGVIALSETLRSELSPFGIGVTAVCPMFFKTNLLEEMRFTDDFESEFAHCTFDNARSSADEVAEAVVKAIEKKRLYVIPQRPGRVLWYIKRLSPGFYFGLLAFLNRTGVGHGFFLFLARRGWLQ
jgi:NAD(P)-dependent dehydrogenase (short-subunit alcohol dehydrogenase family)